MTFPTDKFSQIEIEQITDTRTPDARYFRNRARGNKAPFFMIALTSAKLAYAEYLGVIAKLESYENGLEIFTLPNPKPALAAFPNYLLQANVSAGNKTVSLNRIADYQVGDFIQFSNHAKVYRISQITTGTRTVIGLSCPLVESVTTSHNVIYGANVVFQVCLEDMSPMKIQESIAKRFIVDVELIEQA